MNKCFNIDESVFSYIVSSSPANIFSKHKRIFNNTLTISCSKKTDILYAEHQNQAIAIIGFCVDSHREIERNSIPEETLSQNFPSSEAAFLWFNRFAGKYVILFKSYSEIYVWGDATCSVPINYTCAAFDLCISSSDNLIAKNNGFPVSEYSKKIRLGSDLSQALPWNMTMYDEIKALLPNHYLSLSSRNVTRVSFEASINTNKTNISNTLSQTLFTVTNIAKEYTQYYNLSCPLTSGFDSRVVYAILSDVLGNFDCYTFRHANFSPNEGDIVIPAEICKHYNRKHIIIDDIEAPDDYIHSIKEVLGDYIPNRLINIAYTYNSELSEYAQINGDIIDQIGKSLIGNNIPTGLASSAFFQCKIHNKEISSRSEIKKHIDSMMTAGKKENIFDLFAMENRCGRWASQTSMIYSACGITSLNFFNCRELILLWSSIPRKARTQKQIHHYLFNELDPSLLNFSFNPGSKLNRIIKENWLAFYLATFAKQFTARK